MAETLARLGAYLGYALFAAFVVFLGWGLIREGFLRYFVIVAGFMFVGYSVEALIEKRERARDARARRHFPPQEPPT